MPPGGAYQTAPSRKTLADVNVPWLVVPAWELAERADVLGRPWWQWAGLGAGAGGHLHSFPHAAALVGTFRGWLPAGRTKLPLRG